MVDDKLLSEIEERCKSSSAAQWHASGHYVSRPSIGAVIGRFAHADDAEFCANARQDVPNLVLEVRRLKTLNADMLAALKGIMPDNFNVLTPHLEDDEAIPLDVSLAELRAVRGAIAKAEGQS